MQQTFALSLSPISGRVSLRPVSSLGMTCQPFMTFQDVKKAQKFLDNGKAVRMFGGETINGTYTMEVRESEMRGCTL